MYENVGAYILWLVLLAKYLIKECNMTRIKADLFIFYKKYYYGKFELGVSVYVGDVFMTGRPETLENIK